MSNYSLVSAEEAKTAPEKETPSAEQAPPVEQITPSDETTAQRLERILKQAADSGFVSLKGENGTEEAANPAPSPDVAAQPQILPPVTQQTPQTPKRASLRLAPVGKDRVKPKPKLCDVSDVFYFDEETKTVTYDEVLLLRQKLLDSEADYSSPDGVILAKAYMSLGLAEEAIAVSKVLTSEQGKLLTMLGRVMALEPLPHAEELRAYGACSKQTLPWIAMSHATDNPAEALRLTALSTGELFELPNAIKRLFATQLGILAAEESQWDLAEELAKIASDAANAPDASVLYLNSLLDSHSGDKEAMKVMKEVALKPSPIQAKALLSLGYDAARKNKTPYKEYLADLDLLKVQYKGGTAGATAEIMEIRLLVESTDYSDMVERVLAQFRSGSEDRKIVRDIIATSMQQSLAGTDVARKFSALNGFIDHRSFFEGYQQFVQLKYLAASAALSFELPQVVLAMLGPEDVKMKPAEADRLFAEAALLMGKPVEALKLASRHEGQVFTDISIRAANKMDIPGQAVELLKKYPQTEENLSRRARIAWDAGDWGAAREAYADLLLANTDDALVERHALAAYMSGEGGGFYDLKTPENIPSIEQVLETYADEKEILEGYLSNG